MALIDRHATSLLTADSEIVWAFDKVGRCGYVRDLDAPNCEFGNLDDSNWGLGILVDDREHVGTSLKVIGLVMMASR